MKCTKVLASLALLTILPGTASAFLGLGVVNDWQASRAHAPLQAMHFVIPAKDLSRACGTNPAATTYGCAIRDAASKVCLIYTAPNPAQWVMEHEQKHCDGWDHSPTHYAAANNDTHVHAN